MRNTVRPFVLLPMIAGCLLAGCATAPSRPPQDFSGTWMGRLEVASYKLQQGGVVSGHVQVVLEQRGTWLTGELVCLGLRGRVNARVDGSTFSGEVSGQARNVGGSVPFSGTLVGDQLEGRLDGSPMRLHREPR